MQGPALFQVGPLFACTFVAIAAHTLQLIYSRHLIIIDLDKSSIPIDAASVLFGRPDLFDE